MDKVVLGTAFFLLIALTFFGLAIWLLFFNPAGSYGLSWTILGILVAFPLIFYLYTRKAIQYFYMLILYSLLAFATLVISIVMWNPLNVVSDYPGYFSFLMVCLGCLGSVFGLKTTKTISTTQAIIASIGIVVFYFATMFMTTNPYNIVSSNRGIVIAIGAIALVLGLLIALKELNYIQFKDVKTMDIIKYSLLTIGILVVFLALIYGIFYAVQHVNSGTNFLLVFINALIIIVLAAFIIKFFNLDKKLQSKPGGDPSWIGLVKKLLFYLPCSIINLVEYIKEQYKITPKVVWQLLGIEILLILGRFLIPYLYEKFMNSKGTLLVRKPEDINKEVFLANFEDLNYYKSDDANKDSSKEEMQNYHYSISAWIYINSFPPNTNVSYTKDTSILNIGNKPNIQFNVEKNELVIRMKETSEKEVVVLRKRDLLKYQKWNHIVVVYNGGTLDVFINNELISTKSNIIPLKQYDIVSYGSDDGIFGGICNVKYFNEKLSRSEINWLYNTAKIHDPPVI
jgi:hypothetical protein